MEGSGSFAYPIFTKYKKRKPAHSEVLCNGEDSSSTSSSGATTSLFAAVEEDKTASTCRRTGHLPANGCGMPFSPTLHISRPVGSTAPSSSPTIVINNTAEPVKTPFRERFVLETSLQTHNPYSNAGGLGTLQTTGLDLESLPNHKIPPTANAICPLGDNPNGPPLKQLPSSPFSAAFTKPKPVPVYGDNQRQEATPVSNPSLVPSANSVDGSGTETANAKKNKRKKSDPTERTDEPLEEGGQRPSGSATVKQPPVAIERAAEEVQKGRPKGTAAEESHHEKGEKEAGAQQASEKLVKKTGPESLNIPAPICSTAQATVETTVVLEAVRSRKQTVVRQASTAGEATSIHTPAPPISEPMSKLSSRPSLAMDPKNTPVPTQVAVDGPHNRVRVPKMNEAKATKSGDGHGKAPPPKPGAATAKVDTLKSKFGSATTKAEAPPVKSEVPSAKSEAPVPKPEALAPKPEPPAPKPETPAPKTEALAVRPLAPPTTVLPTPEVESSTWQLVGRKSVDKITGKAFSGVVGPGADGGPTKKKKSKKKADPVEQKGEPEEEREPSSGGAAVEEPLVAFEGATDRCEKQRPRGKAADADRREKADKDVGTKQAAHPSGQDGRLEKEESRPKPTNASTAKGDSKHAESEGKDRKAPQEKDRVSEEPRKKQKQKKPKLEKEDIHEWDDALLTSLIEKYRGTAADTTAEDREPPPPEDPAEARLARRKRRKEAQERKDLEHPDVLTHMARHQTEMKHRQQAMLQYFQTADELAGQHARKEQLANLGKALVMAQQLQSNEAVTKCYEKIAKVYEGMEDYARAIQYHEKAFGILQNPQDMSQCCREIAAAYERLGDYDAALEYHARSVRVMEKTSPRLEELRDAPHRGLLDPILASGATTCTSAEKLQGFGNMCLTMWQGYRSAVVCFEIARQVYSQDKATEHLQALPLQSLGELHLILKDYRRARSMLEKSIALCQDHANDPRIQDCLVKAQTGLGRCLLKEGKPKPAEAALRKALERAQSFGILHPTSSVSPELRPLRPEVDVEDCYGLLQCALVEQRRPEEALLVVENGRGKAAVDTFRRTLPLEDRVCGMSVVTTDSIRDVAAQLNATLVYYAELEPDVGCWVVKPRSPTISFLRLKKPSKRRSRDWESDDLTAPNGSEALHHLQQALIAPIWELLPHEKDALIGFVISDGGFLREVPFASLAAPGGALLSRDHPLFTVHSAAVLALVVDVLVTARRCPADLPVGLSDFHPHVLVPHPDDPSKMMGVQHRHLLNEWGVDVLLASLPFSACPNDPGP
jgi:tetratricopeptide (TPR) repeat protein